MNKTRFSKAEESANAISHGFGLILAIVATYIIVHTAVICSDIWMI